MQKAVRDLYGLRSKIVHSGSYEVTDEDLGQLRTLTKRALIRLLQRKSAWQEKPKTLDDWFDGLLSTYRDRILPVTTEIAQEWGRYNVPPKAPPIVDGLLAATAKVHRLTLVTRNVRDFAGTGIDLLDPWAFAP